MPQVLVREIAPPDRDIWLAMYRTLFTGQNDPALLKEIDRIYAAPDATAFLAFAGDQPVGFAEYALRPHANGCHSKPVPFLEGVWVDPTCRLQGVGAALIAHLAEYAKAQGFDEMGSDVEIGNTASQTVHLRLGFEETERVVCYRKDLR